MDYRTPFTLDVATNNQGDHIHINIHIYQYRSILYSIVTN